MSPKDVTDKEAGLFFMAILSVITLYLIWWGKRTEHTLKEKLWTSGIIAAAWGLVYFAFGF